QALLRHAHDAVRKGGVVGREGGIFHGDGHLAAILGQEVGRAVLAAGGEGHGGHGVGPVGGVQHHVGADGVAAEGPTVLLHVDAGGSGESQVQVGGVAVGGGGGSIGGGVDDGLFALHAGVGGAENIALVVELVGVLVSGDQHHVLVGVPGDLIQIGGLAHHV